MNEFAAFLQQATHYLSTACLHEHHDQCRRTCKFCQSPCRCDCHQTAGEPVGGTTTEETTMTYDPNDRPDAGETELTDDTPERDQTLSDPPPPAEGEENDPVERDEDGDETF